jgi:hypothetical protein
MVAFLTSSAIEDSMDLANAFALDIGLISFDCFIAEIKITFLSIHSSNIGLKNYRTTNFN